MKSSLFLFSLLFMAGCSGIYDYLGGGQSSGNPLAMRAELSESETGRKALAMIDEAYGIKEDIVDGHLHILGSGGSLGNLCPEIGESGIYINPNRFQPFLHPILSGMTQVMMSSSKSPVYETADEDSVKRLLELVKPMPMNTKFVLLAMDWYRDDSGKPVPEKTDLFVPNDYIVKLCSCLNRHVGRDAFIPAISVHPRDPESSAILDKYHSLGVRYVKWLPNAMNLDPADQRNIPFYQKMAGLEGMALVSHTGYEEAIHVIDGKDAQVFGNPERIALALQNGVTVILSHSGGETRCERKQHIDTFVGMMKDARRNNWKLYGDISGLTLKKNVDHFGKIIGNEDMKHRMLYGSDYPLPAIYFLYNGVCALVKKGYLDKELEKPLKLIFKYNPLIFDFVLKRNLHAPGNPKLKLPDEVFRSLEKNRVLEIQGN